MTTPLPVLHIVRHSETAWSLSGQHTGRTDLPLTERGERHASLLRARLAGLRVDHVFTSPLQRATRTCELAGFAERAVRDDDLMEWHYGRYEGMLAADIRAQHPGWQVFRDGCPDGESVADVVARVDRFIARVRALNADALAFSSGHLLRTLACRWVGLEPATLGPHIALGTASVGMLGYEGSLNRPVIRLWNDTAHVGD